MQTGGTPYYFDPELRRKVESILLPDVQLPGQYIGGELGRVVKEARTVRGRFCFSFPDAYTIGMSNYALQVLYAIVNARPDLCCERAFAPFPDMEAKLRQNDLPLYSLETFSPLWSFDVVGFTLQHELGSTNILTMLDLGRIPIHREERRAEEPLVMAGGPAAFNPEPLAPFFDFFLIGDGEAAQIEMIDYWLELRAEAHLPRAYESRLGKKPEGWEALPLDESRRLRREMLLKMARRFPWGYVPEFYSVEIAPSGRARRPRPTEPGVPEYIRPAIIRSLNDYPPPASPVVPLVESVHDRVAIEIMRGCPQKCRFCQSTTIKRPLRFRDIKPIVDSAIAACCSTGGNEVTLLSLSSSEYLKFDELINEFSRRASPKGIAVSVPSLRVNHQLSEVVGSLTTERSSALTIAPEAALDSMREKIAKKVTNEDLMNGCRSAFEHGFYRIKMYFMVGFPGETDEDIDGIIDLCEQVSRLGKEVRGKWPVIVANVSNFIPKPQTPLQWAPMATEEVLRRTHERLRRRPRGRSIDLKYHYLKASLLEGLLARGDRRLAKMIELAWQKGARFEAWKDRFDWRVWDEAEKEAGIDRQVIAHTPYRLDEELPWDHITIWAGKEKLKKEARESGMIKPDSES
ncbi:MAG: radical SAM protein [Thermoguttaceae bacterium]|jgi:radical SAM superfamily enzyme YgiQ (UPF0313 family)